MNGGANGGLSCPVPANERERILLGHGGGGRLMHNLLRDTVFAKIPNCDPKTMHDGAILRSEGQRLAFTTDSYVVKPLFFAGGSIGSLAVYGTVNDLAMCGARPLALSCALIIEEGLELSILERVLSDMALAADKAGVAIRTGDTKVVERGKADGLYINTAGIGALDFSESNIGPGQIQAGDVVLLSGDVGRHGVAVLAAREGLEFGSTIESDNAPLWEPVRALLEAGIEIHCLRDLTRGGLAQTAIELCEQSGLFFQLDESEIFVLPEVTAACEILGLDPLYLANEGRFVVVLPEKFAARALEVLTQYDAAYARRIGFVGRQPGPVRLRSRIGTERILDMQSGEQLPRIC